MQIVDRPLDWYADKIVRGEPFSMGLFGDGEALAMFQEMPGRETAEGEVFCTEIGLEIRDFFRKMALFPQLLVGSAPYVATTWGKRLEKELGGQAIEWLNGEIFDYDVRDGKLGPLIKAIQGRPLCLVGNNRLRGLGFFRSERFVEIPMHKAYEDIDRIERECAAYGKPAVYVFCAGLTAMPLIARLIPQLPAESWLIDMGSVFDVFVGLGAQRGWRAELYADKARLDACINANLA